MARPLRLEHPGAVWHVTSRGNERRDIVRSDRDRRLFIDILAESVILHRWILYGYVLMRNHYHCLVETPEPTLSAGVKRINEIYAQAFNVLHGRVGHLFQGRFKGILVEREPHLLELIRYVVLNPVRCGAVEHASDYEWSSYRATAGVEAVPGWLATDWTLAQFGGGSRGALQESYRRLVADGRGAHYRPWEQLVGSIYLGGEAFCDRLQALVGHRREDRGYPKQQRIFVRASFSSIIELVCEEFGVSESQLRRRSHDPARRALAQLGWHEAGVSLAAIGAWMNITDRGVSHLVRRGKEWERTDRDYAEAIRAVRRRLGLEGTDPSPF